MAGAGAGAASPVDGAVGAAAVVGLAAADDVAGSMPVGEQGTGGGGPPGWTAVRQTEMKVWFQGDRQGGRAKCFRGSVAKTNCSRHVSFLFERGGS